jgi:hypothetical protein
VIYAEKFFSVQTVKLDAKQRVIAPGQTERLPHLPIRVPLGGLEAPYEQIAQIHCSDLAGVSNHTFGFRAGKTIKSISRLGSNRFKSGPRVGGSIKNPEAQVEPGSPHRSPLAA